MGGCVCGCVCGGGWVGVYVGGCVCNTFTSLQLWWKI